MKPKVAKVPIQPLMSMPPTPRRARNAAGIKVKAALRVTA